MRWEARGQIVAKISVRYIRSALAPDLSVSLVDNYSIFDQELVIERGESCLGYVKELTILSL